MASIESLIGAHIVGKDDKDVDWDSITGPGKTLGLYFSAHWCPPCRGFTPKLADYYNEMKKKPSGKDFEIIFVSSDRDAASFADYYKEMPWLALKFEQRDAKNDLSKKYNVRGIPTFVILNGESGDTITVKGREKVLSDPEGFPWYPKGFAEIFYNGDFVKNDGTKIPSAELKSKIKAVYFSAHWCPPCRAFTPQLSETYKKLQDSGKAFEIVFASSDENEEQFKEYFSEMPWLALPFEDGRKAELSDLCDVDGIPTLAIFDENDRKITFQGRGAVGADPEGKEFPWVPKALNALTEDTASVLNEQPCLIYFTGDKEEEIKKAKELLLPIAERETKEDHDCSLVFLYTHENEDLLDSLKSFTKLKKEEPFVAVIDIPSQEVFEFEAELNAENLDKFVTDFIAGKLEGRQIK